MAYTVPLTAVTGVALSAAQWNASVRDNILETPAAKFTASGQLFISTGPNAGAARTIAGARTTGGPQTIATTTFGNMTTVGPTLSGLSLGSACLVFVSSFVMNTTAGQGGYMGHEISGATARLAAPERALRLMSSNASERNRASHMTYEFSLTPGTHQIQAKYATVTAGNTAEYDEREIACIPV